MSANSPMRPAAAKDVETMLNGSPTLLGVIVSAGAAADNSSAASVGPTGTAGGFNTLTLPTNGAQINYGLTLGGRVLLVVATAAGYITKGATPLGTPNQPTVVGVVNLPTPTTQPGIPVQASERIPLIMNSQDGWLQFVPATGAANLVVWELT